MNHQLYKKSRVKTQNHQITTTNLGDGELNTVAHSNRNSCIEGIGDVSPPARGGGEWGRSPGNYRDRCVLSERGRNYCTPPTSYFKKILNTWADMPLYNQISS